MCFRCFVLLVTRCPNNHTPVLQPPVKSRSHSRHIRVVKHHLRDHISPESGVEASMMNYLSIGLGLDCGHEENKAEEKNRFQLTIKQYFTPNLFMGLLHFDKYWLGKLYLWISRSDTVITKSLPLAVMMSTWYPRNGLLSPEMYLKKCSNHAQLKMICIYPRNLKFNMISALYFTSSSISSWIPIDLESSVHVSSTFLFMLIARKSK